LHLLDIEESNKRVIKLIKNTKITNMIRNINPTNIIIIIRIGLINFTIKITKNKMTKNLFSRCGKTCHYQSICKIKIEINKTEIAKFSTKSLKDKFLKMLTIDSNNDSLDDNALDNEILQIENSSESLYSSDSSEDGIELCQCDSNDLCTCKKTINVLKKKPIS
jgi:hypothetical protein